MGKIIDNPNPVSNHDVNGYLSNVIHEQKVQNKRQSHSKDNKDMFCSECINNSLTDLDITVESQ